MQYLKQVFVLCIALVFIVAGTGCKPEENETKQVAGVNKPIVAVSIVPQASFVKAIGGEFVDIVTMIPPGKSPENYAPNPRELERFSKASIYFTIGVPAEKAMVAKANDLNKALKLVDQAAIVATVYKDREFAPGERDPHIWLSPKRAKVMVQNIVQELSALDPVHKDIFEKNGRDYLARLDNLDQNIRTSLQGVSNRTFIVFHPAMGYFASDYDLTMIALEEEGKEASPQHMKEVIDLAKKQGIKVIFYQEEMDSKQSRAFAEEIGGKTEQVAPLASDYITNLEKTAALFAAELKK